MPAFLQIDPATVQTRRLAEFIQPLDLGSPQGRYLQLRMVNTRGYAELKSVRVYAEQGGKGMDRKEAVASR